MKALVTGASGAIGPAIVAGLVADGWSVRAFVRRHEARALFPDDVDLLVGDLERRSDIVAAVDGVDVVFHLAATLHRDLPSPGPATRALYERVNVDATRALAAAARDGGVTRFVHFSTISVYGATAGGPMQDEQSRVHPESLYGETKLRGEAAALDAPGAVVLRLAAVYGARMKGNYGRLLRAVKRGVAVGIGRGSNRRTLVHERDVVQAAVVCARSAPAGSIYNVTDGTVHTVREIVDTIAASLNRQPLRLALPLAPTRIGVGVVEDACRLIRVHPPIRRSMVDKFVEDVAVSGARLQRELGFRPKVSLEQGWRQVVDALA